MRVELFVRDDQQIAKYLPSIPVQDVDRVEAELVIARTFARCETRADERAVDYFDDGGRRCATLHLEFNGCALGLQRHAGLTKSLEDNLVARWEAAFDVVEPLVWREIAFFSQPVTGSWRHGELFQVVPPPADAPQVEQLAADHPGVLEVAVLAGGDAELNMFRFDRAVGELALVLGLVLPSPVSPRTRSQRRTWAYRAEGARTPEWLYIGYPIAGFEQVASSFTTTTSSAPTCSIEEDPGLVRFELAIPDEADELVYAFYALDDPARTKFLRACLWYRTATAQSTEVASLQILGLVQAVECLLQPADGADPNAQVASRFKAFLREFAPGPPSGGEIDRLYDLRSGLAHGSRLMSGDILQALAVAPEVAWDAGMLYAARALCRGALLNWLADRAAPGKRVVTQKPRRFRRYFSQRVVLSATPENPSALQVEVDAQVDGGDLGFASTDGVGEGGDEVA